MKQHISLLALAIVIAGCGDKKSEKAFEMPPVPVQTAEVEVRDVPLYFEAMGVVKPSRSAEVKPQVSGIIKQVHFEEGEWVEEGAPLYTLEDTSYSIRVQEVKGQLSQNQAHLANVKKKLARYKSLTKQDLISKVEWDELETQVALHEAMVRVDEARLAAAELDLEHCRIAAPIAGFTGKSALGQGNLVSGAITLVTLTQTEPLSVDFLITEKELQNLISESPAVKIYAAGDDACIAIGKVTFLDHAINEKSGMLAASATLSKTQTPLWPGQSVRVHLFFGTKEQALLVPMRAIKTNQNGPYLFTVKEDNTVEIRNVKLGPEEKGQIVIEEGLIPTDKVVTEGQLRLFVGSKIEEVRS